MSEEIRIKNSLPVYIGSLFVLFIIFLGISIKLDIFSSEGEITAEDEKRAGELLNEGCFLFESKFYKEAIEVWEEVYYDYKGTTSWGKATYNIGLGYLCMEEYEEAIPYFEEILESDVDDLEPGQCVMEAYRNYRYKSCLQISYCYERLEDLDTALKYSILARDKYPYQSWCGTCQMYEDESLNYQIKRLTLLKKWESNKDVYCEFKLEYEIISDSDIEYNLYLPYPKATDQSTYYFINQTKIVYGNPDYNIINERNSIGLNITCKGSCMIEIEYILTINNDLSPNKIFSGLGLEDKEYYSIYWFFLSDKNKYSLNEIKLNINGYWIKYPPKWEYYSWDIQNLLLDLGWNEKYINEQKATYNNIFYEYERKPRPRDGNCLEYDHEREILLIGTNNGLGLYNPIYDTYEIIGDGKITSICIDYKRDIYYLGVSGLNRLKIYNIRNYTFYFDNNYMKSNINISWIIFDDFDDKLIIDNVSDVDLAYYDHQTKQLFSYNNRTITILNHTTNSSQFIKLTEVITKKNNFTKTERNRLLYQDIYDISDIIYDPFSNKIFLSIDYHSELEGPFPQLNLISINLTNNKVKKIYLYPKYPINIKNMDLSIKNRELYLGSNYNIYIYNLITKKTKYMGEKIGKSIYASPIMTYDENNDVLYFISSWRGTLSKYNPTNGEVIRI
jgi:hypothetical protein